MPINSSRANASARAYGFTANRRRPSPLVSFNPSAAATFSFVPHPLGPTFPNYEVMTITGSGTLRLDPLIPISGPTQFTMEYVTVGGGGGGGRRNTSTFFPSTPFPGTGYYPRFYSAPGGGGGGGVSPLQTWYATSRTIPIGIGAGGSSNNNGNLTSFGPPAVPAGNPTYNSSAGGGAGGSSTTGDNGNPNNPGAGYWLGGSGGGSSNATQSRTTIPRPFPFGGPFFSYPVSYNSSTAGTATGSGFAGADGRTPTTAGSGNYYYINPSTGASVEAVGIFGGSGGGAGSAATSPNRGEPPFSYSPITRGSNGQGVPLTNITGTPLTVGGGGNGTIMLASPVTSSDPTGTFLFGALMYAHGGGSEYPPFPLNGTANTGGGGGGISQPWGATTPSNSMPNYNYDGGSGGSGLVIVRYPVPSAR